ncbi:sodium-coupled monocarboxylate transporter 2-like [Drosophila hydei]|uniref:Sodium-coupled monocarboxylate transporter 2-like n=1 Tax=Drosophila hydei TaxID=7224 RepID=A0A6J1LQI4_DROHY|nr:sodium-coupled monocarboxylate transporter 2-like [Drosophila hydei]
MEGSSPISNMSSALTFGITDYVVFVLMLCASLAIGIYFGFFSKAKNTTEEYLRGSKKMQTVPIAISLVASQLSGIAIMSVPAETYTFGFNYIFIVLSMVLVVPLLIYVVASVFYENNVSNCYEYLEIRFGKFMRKVVTLTFVLNLCLMLPVYMFIPSLAFAQVSGLNIHLINIVVSSICVSYTMLGGIKAVVWTDVVQGGIMLTSVILVGVLGTVQAGGLSSVLESASKGGRLDFDYRLDPRIRLTVWNGLMAGFVMWLGHIGFNQSCVQRIVALPSYAHAKVSLIIASCGILLIMGVMSFTGIIMFARYFGCDPMLAGLVSKPDKMMPFFIQDIMGNLPGMPGLFISCVFSAALSTLSANLNSLAGVVYFDYIKPFIRHTEARANATMKLTIILMGIYCIFGGFVVQHFNSIIQTVMSITGISTGAVTAVFLLGILCPRVNSKAASSGIIFSIVVMVAIVIKTQMQLKAGVIKYDILPNTLDQCEAKNLYTIFNATYNNNEHTTPISVLETPTEAPLVTGTFGSNRDFSIFEISFFWYKFLGAILTFLWALPMSYICKRDKQESLDPKLFTPFVRKFLPPNLVLELEELPLKVSPLAQDL